ncbi:hypothetical protein MHYMCMPASI_00278 [Hyalomma marginatum]|uniref:Uncharacterized protein n=1 Tax=Hyalomma marginatum TaxID=34627 RepID=A0A8S4BVJ7_9ACAR|nr:hypothetical protein MHYMCMPASI_00278 [Hyalomma marginatum]
MEALSQHKVKSVLAIEMAFCGKKMELVHQSIQLTQQN